MKRTIAKNAATKLMATAAAVLMMTGQSAMALDQEAQLKLGEIEYMASCAACHGSDGKGAGPVAEVLSQGPSDLTTITARYSGTFPSEQLYKTISGEQMINPHGDREMPVWGPRYWQDAVKRAGEVPHDVDAQAMVHGRITALVQYIESIQAQ